MPPLSQAGVVVTVLEVQSEEMLGDVVVRWVRVPMHLREGCEHAETDLMVVGTLGLWCPAALLLVGQPRDELREELTEDNGWEAGVARYVAAFGCPWEQLSMPVARGLLVLMQALEDETLDVLHGLDPVRLVELRLACPRPAQVVRALRAMREYGARTQ